MRELKKHNISEKTNEFIKAIQYLNDSKKGKLDLDTYLDMMGQFTDSEIVSAKKDGLEYLEGKCTVVPEMFFRAQNGDEILKEFTVDKPTDFFVRETKDLFQNDAVLIYEIEAPKETSL